MLVVERGLSLAAKPSAVMAVMRGPTPGQNDRLVQQQATFNYLCNACLISKLPFTDTQDDEPDVDVSIDSSDDIYKVFCRKGLHFVHLNIRSLPPSIDEIRTIATQTKAAVIALTET